MNLIKQWVNHYLVIMKTLFVIYRQLSREKYIELVNLRLTGEIIHFDDDERGEK
jgi:hypothetical protein